MKLEPCVICFDNNKFWSVGACDHVVCYICSLRIRFLYRSMKCPLCKCDQGEIILFPSSMKNKLTFSQLKTQSFLLSEQHSVYGIGDAVKEAYNFLLRLNCPFRGCIQYFDNSDSLKRHVKNEHQLLFCDVCLKHKKVFSHEFPLFTPRSLENHKKGSAKDKGSGHPKCGFCNILFYTDEDLYDHCKKNHLECFICARAGINHIYFSDYATLEKHFESKHFLCTFPSCLEQKMVVFETEIELIMHKTAEHAQTKKHQRIVQNTDFFANANNLFSDADHQPSNSRSSIKSRSSHFQENTSNEKRHERLHSQVESLNLEAAAAQQTSSYRTRIASQLKDICKNDNLILDALKQYENSSISCNNFIKLITNNNSIDLLSNIFELIFQLINNKEAAMIFRRESNLYLKNLENFPSFPAPNTSEPKIKEALPKPTSSRSKLSSQLPANPKVIRLDSRKVPVSWGEQARRLQTTQPRNSDVFSLPTSSSAASITPNRTVNVNSQRKVAVPLSYKFTPSSSKAIVDNEDFPSLEALPSNQTNEFLEELQECEENEDSFVLGAPGDSFADICQTSNSQSQSSKTKPKKNKKIVLFHIGL